MVISIMDGTDGQMAQETTRQLRRKWKSFPWQVQTMGLICVHTVILTYDINLRGGDVSKEFMDELRCRNGNLNIICGRESDKDML